MKYHKPVLLKECIEGLNINPEGIYVDVTFGGGGHSKEILKRLTTGRLIAFDQDHEATINAIKDERFLLLQQNFRHLKSNLKLHSAFPINGLLADLGVSSHQIDSEERGFSTRFDTELDMRMDPNSALTAAQILNEYPKDELYRIFREYGEIRNSSRLTSAIVSARQQKPISTVFMLKEAISECADIKRENQYYARVFQALRIEVNNELESLKELLLQSEGIISENGRLVVISYHSLEDRLVKNFVRAGNFKGEVKKDFYGNVLRPFEPINRNVIIPGKEELEKNNRARSAKMRVSRRIKYSD